MDDRGDRTALPARRRVGTWFLALAACTVLAAPSLAQEATDDEPAPAAAEPTYRSIDRTGEDVIVGPGEVVGDVRVSSGTLTVRGEVRGRITAMDTPVNIEEGGVVHGDVRSAFGRVVVASGGRALGSVTAVGADGSLEAGGEIRRRFVVVGGQRIVAPGATLGEQDTPPSLKGLLFSMAVLLWLLGTTFGAGIAYAVADLAADRVATIASFWRRSRGRVVSWAIALVGLCIALLLLVCVGWAVLVPLLAALGAAAALGWVTFLQGVGRRITRGRSRTAVRAAMVGWAVWAAVGLIGLFPCLLPLVMLLKAVILVLCAGAALLTDWGRDAQGRGCWPFRATVPLPE